MLVIAYTLTDDMTEGRTAKNMTSLDSNIFDLTEANVRKWKRGDNGGETTAGCWALMAERCSTKMLCYCRSSQKTINSLLRILNKPP